MTTATPSSQSAIPCTIAFIGGGNVARSMIGGLVGLGMPASDIAVSEPDATLRAALARDFGVVAHAANTDAVADADLWVLAVKPQVLRGVCEELAQHAKRIRPLVVTLAAGIPIGAVENWLRTDDQRPPPLVRAMPNTPALLRASATALCANAHVSAAQRGRAQALFEAVGLALWVDDEALMDTVTATSGSGPAYVFALVEAMQAAAVAQGLPADVARALIAQTVFGAGRMLVESGEDAATLRRRVTSPGGVTEQALRCFAEGGLDALIAGGIAAATARGAELAAVFAATETASVA
ncbi:MAG: pyrroline-5-carboxylate reductase [Proteobacteria bacterium]|nr:pyrroline-5-carboxylate reductase [Pseudomonadota bacterium]MBS0464366.1 pyrroline-5-carboxylate reductase [Pseudomonadota bacterium]